MEQTMLMCPPDFFEVSYEINPWMKGQINASVQKRAEQQWEHLANLIGQQMPINIITPKEKLPDMVFTANAGLVSGNKVVVSRFTPKERQGESQHFRDWFKTKGYEVMETPAELPFEGAGDALFDDGKGILWVGYGFRSAADASVWLEQNLGREVHGLKLVDPRFYHLDTCFCPLKRGYIMYYPEAFAPESLELLKEKISPDLLIPVEEDDAIAFACNAVNIDDTIIMHKASDSLKKRLAAIGFEVKEAPVDEFLKAGGSTKCLTLKLPK